MTEEQKHPGGRPTKYNEVTVSKVDEYIQQALEAKELPTIAGLATYIGVVKSTIHKWKDEHSEFSDSLGKMVQIQEKILINKGLNSEYNSTIAKLILSANHGYAEKTEQTAIMRVSVIDYAKYGNDT